MNAGEPDGASWLNAQGFSNVQSQGYWSSTTRASYTVHAWDTYKWEGQLAADDKGNAINYVWAVRAASTPPSELWKTGQTTIYRTGDDGDLEAGVAWPSSRFTVQGECVTDDVSGLMWAQNANLPGGTVNWQEGLNYANNLNLCGYSDWRLPNHKELLSLVDRSRSYPALPAGHPFTNVQPSEYWSSTTNAVNKAQAWAMSAAEGYVTQGLKADGSRSAWPVRGK